MLSAPALHGKDRRAFLYEESMLGAMTKDYAKSAKEARDYTDGAGLSSARHFRDVEEMKRVSIEASNILKEGQRRQRTREPRGKQLET